MLTQRLSYYTEWDYALLALLVLCRSVPCTSRVSVLLLPPEDVFLQPIIE